MGGSPASRGCDTRCVRVCHMRPAQLSGRLLPHASSAGPGEAGIGVHPAPPAHEHVSCVGATMVSKQAGLAGIHQGFRPPSNTSLPDDLLVCGGLQACTGQRSPHQPPHY